jgi:hypothetical protein
MKKLLAILLTLLSIEAYSQSGSTVHAAIRSRVPDSTTVVFPSGYGVLYYNAQSSKWRICDSGGTNCRDIGSGSGGGGLSNVTTRNRLEPNEKTSSFTLSLADTSSMIILENVADLVITLDDFSAFDHGAQWVFYRKDSAGVAPTDTVYFDDGGETLQALSLGIGERSYAYLYYNPDDNEFYLSASSIDDGGTQDLQDVLDNGSSASITTDYNVVTSEGAAIQTTGTGKLLQFINDDGGLIQLNEDAIVQGAESSIIATTGEGHVISNTGAIELRTTQYAYLHGGSAKAGELRLQEDSDNGSNYVGLIAPASIGTSYTITLPSSAPSTDTYLKYNGTNYVWDVAGGGNVTTRNIIQSVEYKVNDYTLVPGDTSTVLIFSGSVSTLTLGDFSALPSGKGYQFFFHNDQATSVTVDPAGNPYKFSLTIADSSFGYILFANDTFRIARTGTSSGGGSGVVETIVAGNLIDVDATDPANPIVSVETGDKGDITIGANSLQIDALAVTNAEINDVAVGKITGFGAGVGTYLGTPTWTNFLLATTGTAPYWATTGTSTLTGASIIANGGNTLTFNGAAGTTFSHTVVDAFRITGTIPTTTASLQQHTLFDPTINTRATVSDITRGIRVAPIMVAGTTGQQLFALSVSAAGLSATNNPSKWAAEFEGGLVATTSAAAPASTALFLNRTTSSGNILQVQSNSSNILLITDAAGSTAASITGLGSLANVLNLTGTILASSGSAAIQTNSATMTATANGDALRSRRGVEVYGANTRTGVLAYVDYNNATYTQSTGNFNGGIFGYVLDQTASSLYRRSGLNAGPTPTATLHLGAPTTAANSASLKFNEGSRQTTPEDGTLQYVSNNIEFAETSTVYILSKTLVGSSTLDFPSVASLAAQSLTVTVTGAADGDKVVIGYPNASDDDGIIWKSRVSAANTVTITAVNYTLGSIDPASGTFKVSVIKD